MDIKELQKIMQENGVVGAGGAGFPTYMKLTDKADTILMNCAECEPLLKLHRQLLEKHAYEIMKTFDMVAETVGASQAIIGIKKSYVQTINALNQHIEEFPRVKIHLLDEVYPMGDEVVLIYEATGRVVRPGGLPIEQGVAVFNVETLYNVYQSKEAFGTTKKAMINSGKMRILVVDSTKFDQTAFSVAGQLRDVEMVITDKKPSEKWLDHFNRHKIECIYPK